MVMEKARKGKKTQAGSNESLRQEPGKTSVSLRTNGPIAGP